MKKVLLDTNAYSKLRLSGGDIQKELEASDTVYISVVTIGELVTGFRNGTKFKENLEKLNSFLLKPNVEAVHISEETAEIYGGIFFELLKRGIPVPTNDAWIAANAIETGSKVITFDKHFTKIPGVRVWRGV